MPASQHSTLKHRSSKPAHLSAKTAEIAPKTFPIRTHAIPQALLKRTEMSGNEREIGFNARRLWTSAHRSPSRLTNPLAPGPAPLGGWPCGFLRPALRFWRRGRPWFRVCGLI